MSAIKKVEVTQGVAWVEIPEAELYVLCGCPADSVKHLMRRGLIAPVEHEGVHFETGPNAILLSDSLIQNGVFCNLAEFPVLQMLYRQGMLLPGHPNNTGIKPLLIGAAPQVMSQMRYIYRGNYGLVSEGELRQAGLSKAQAHEAMRIKKRFAFDNIRPSEEFLDSLSVGEEDVAIRNGVMIHRESHNVFVFSYKDETVQVDLNLPKGVTYESPYPLSAQSVGREYFSVIHCGDGDGWDLNRPAMSSIIMFQGDIYLIDAGPNIDHSLLALGIGVNEVKGIFHTHAHDDHFCGLTALMQTDHRVNHYATPEVQASIAKKWAALLSRPESEFEQYFDVCKLQEGQWNNVDGLEVKPVYSPHPVETTVMYFRAHGPEGPKSYGHLADIASRRVLDSFLTDDPESTGLTRSRYERVWECYLTPAEVKKLDIGGGLIHGEAEDFSGDKSGKIILSHLARKLTDKEKEIGSGAAFGMTDVLIKGRQDFVLARAHGYLSEYFPGAKPHELRMLMNSELMEFNAETILIKRGEKMQQLYLIVTGVVEMLDSQRNVSSRLEAGALVGEGRVVANSLCPMTFRAKTHVRALKVSLNQFRRVLRNNELEDYYHAQRQHRVNLLQTWLFGESLSTAVLNKIVDSMTSVTFERGQVIAYGKKPAVFLFESGMAELTFANRTIDRVGPGDFFGEGFALFGVPCLTTAVATQDVRVLVIPAQWVLKAPVVRWKLYETFQHRVEQIVEGVESQKNMLQWRDEYSTGVEEQDDDHRKLFALASDVYDLITGGADFNAVGGAFDAFVGYAREHFNREIEWYRQDDFPEIEHHATMHKVLLEEAVSKGARLRNGFPGRDSEFLMFFKSWLIDHILTEDRKYGRLLQFRKG